MNEWDSAPPNPMNPVIEIPDEGGPNAAQRFFGGSIGFVLAILFSIIFLFLC